MVFMMFHRKTCQWSFNGLGLNTRRDIWPSHNRGEVKVGCMHDVGRHDDRSSACPKLDYRMIALMGMNCTELHIVVIAPRWSV